MKDPRLRGSQQGCSPEDEPIPEGDSPVRDGFPHRRAPGQVGERQIGQDRVSSFRDAVLGGDPLPRLELEIEIRGAVQASEDHRLPREDQRKQDQEERAGERDARDEPPSEPDRESRRRRIRQPQGRNFESQRRRASVGF